jgi:hypothetical protein
MATGFRLQNLYSNREFIKVDSAMNESTGHTHDGTTVGGGAPVTNLAGTIVIRPTTLVPISTYWDAPTSGTTGTDITEAFIMGRLHVKTPTAAQNFQLPTGTQMSAAMPADLTVGDSVEWWLMNLGGTGDVVTVTTDTGNTVVGYMAVHPVDDGATVANSTGHFLSRNTAANTWVTYRL